MTGGSLQRRLLATMAAAFAVLLVVISILLWNYARAAAERTYDLLLAGSVLSILERVSIGPDGPTVDLPTSAMAILGLAPDERVVYAVTSGQGRLITGQEALPLPVPADELRRIGTDPEYYDARLGDTGYRMVIQGRALLSPEGREWVYVQVGQTLGARQSQQLSLFLSGLLGLAAVSLLGLGFVWLAIRASLAPLRQIESDLRRRAPEDLSGVEGQPPREIGGLWEAINEFIARLRQSRALTETFIADVAHQTRTSLSSVVGHLSLAADSSDLDAMRARLVRAEAQAQRTVRLTNQLLANAMVIHRTDESNLRPLSLRPIVRDTLAEMLRDRSMRALPLTFDGDRLGPGADRILGDEVSIREALRNLVDNSVRHGGDGSIVVALAEEGGTVTLSVEDAGPGIASGDRARATERFTPLSQTGGSGLGLAIVRAVAEGHRARLRLGTSALGGLRVEMVFPRIAAAALAIVLCGLTAAPSRADTVEIWSATDTVAINPLIALYEDASPGTDLIYTEFNTVELYEAVLAAPEGAGPDLVISPAMDLQVDLVNRGLARRLSLPEALMPPDWATWRSELFGFTFEPAAIVYNRDTLSDDELPRTHRDLATFIRDNEDRLQGRIGGYDLRGSGIGYLYATQDAEQGLQAQRLTEVLGRAGLRIFCCTSQMLAATSRGDLAFALNVISSYALAEAAEDPEIGVHFLEDFNLVMTRTMYVPRAAANPTGAQAFVEFLLSRDGQTALAERTPLVPISPAAFPAAVANPANNYLPIRLGPGLLTYLDPIKREAFLSGWEATFVSGD